MKHAGEQALDELETLLAALRPLPGMIEKQRGVFYRKSKAFLHFQTRGLFADLRAGRRRLRTVRRDARADRRPVVTVADRLRLADRRHLADGAQGPVGTDRLQHPREISHWSASANRRPPFEPQHHLTDLAARPSATARRPQPSGWAGSAMAAFP